MTLTCGDVGPTIKYLLGFVIPALKVSDTSSTSRGRSYMYGRNGGSQDGLGYMKSTKGNDTYKEMDCDNELDEVELTIRRNMHSDEHVITKTIAW